LQRHRPLSWAKKTARAGRARISRGNGLSRSHSSGPADPTRPEVAKQGAVPDHSIPHRPDDHGWRDDPPLTLIEHRADLLGEDHGFGCFLFDVHGRPVLSGNQAWMYTTHCHAGQWHSWVRSFDLVTHECGQPRRVLAPQGDSDRAVIHHALRVSEDLVVGFLCDGKGVSAATARLPTDTFDIQNGFALRPEPGWETLGGPVADWSLEANGAHVLLSDTLTETTLWLGYDSYLQAGRLGDLGWARVRIDKRARSSSVIERHPANPLAFRAPGWTCARCGGNLASQVRIGGRHAFIFYVRPSESSCLIGLALSEDPLFQQGVERFILDSVRGEEVVAEKFEAFVIEGDLHLFYESRHRNGAWHTGFRRYRIAS
jgi:hypothetical protein